MNGSVGDMNTTKSLKWWQWETLLVTMGGYALYYVIRKNLSIAMPLLGEIGVSKVQLGAFLTAGGIVYGVGRFLNGIVADRNSAREVMATGIFAPTRMPQLVTPGFICSTLMSRLPLIRFGTTMPSNSPQYGQS